MALRALFLDVGNTLFSEEPSRYAIYAEAAGRRGIAVDPGVMKDEMRRAHGQLPQELEGAFRYTDPWFRAFIRRIFHERLGLALDELEPLTAELFARFEDARTFRLYPGATELLAEARRCDLLVGAISNWSARLPRLLRALGLFEAFDFVLCSALERMEKPDPAIFRAALQRAGVSPAEALHAGDHPVQDVEGALAVGIEAVLVDHGGVRGLVPEGVRRITGLAQLSRVILERTGHERPCA